MLVWALVLFTPLAFATDKNIEGSIIDCTANGYLFCQTYDADQESVNGWTEKDDTLYNQTNGYMWVLNAGTSDGRDGKIAYTQEILNASQNWFFEFKQYIGLTQAGESFFNGGDDGGTILDQDVYFSHTAGSTVYILGDTLPAPAAIGFNITVRINLTSTTTADYWVYYDNGTLHSSGSKTDTDLNDNLLLNTYGQAGDRAFYYHAVWSGNSIEDAPFSTPQPDNINISTPQPDNINYSASTVPGGTIRLNVTVNSTYDFECTPTYDEYVLSTVGESAGTNVLWRSIDILLTQGSHNYTIYCQQQNDSTQNETTSTYYFYIDTTAPTISSNLTSGSFVKVGTSKTYQFNFSDNLML